MKQRLCSKTEHGNFPLLPRYIFCDAMPFNGGTKASRDAAHPLIMMLLSKTIITTDENINNDITKHIRFVISVSRQDVVVDVTSLPPLFSHPPMDAHICSRECFNIGVRDAFTIYVRIPSDVFQQKNPPW